MNLTKTLSTALAAAACCTTPLAAAQLDATAEETKKTEVTMSMIGPRDTLIFYLFEKEKAILVVRIDNKDTTFSVDAKLHLFNENVEAEGMEKWINNQHSDGLFPEVPEPKTVHEIPAASCSAESGEPVGQVEEHFGKFTRYSVIFAIKDVPAFGEFEIKDFTDKATVYVRSEGA